MHIRRCPRSHCGRPFQVNRYGLGMADSGAVAYVECPHCGLRMQADGHSVFLTHPLSPEEEAEYDQTHPRPAA